MEGSGRSIGAFSGRLLAEVTVIVLGVLLALGGQAWWEGQQEAKDQSQTLELLRQDLEGFRLLISDVERVVRLQDAIEWLVDVDTDLASEPDSVLRPRAQIGLFSLGRAPRTVDVDGMIPTLADLTGSGRVGLLPDTLRRGLAILQSAIESYARSSLDLVTFQESQLDPLLVSEFRLRTSDFESGPTFQLLDLNSADRDAIASVRVQNSLVLKRSLLINQSRSRESLLLTIDETLSRLEAAIRQLR